MTDFDLFIGFVSLGVGILIGASIQRIILENKK